MTQLIRKSTARCSTNPERIWPAIPGAAHAALWMRPFSTPEATTHWRAHAFAAALTDPGVVADQRTRDYALFFLALQERKGRALCDWRLVRTCLTRSTDAAS